MTDLLIRALLRRAAGDIGGRLSILIFHRVLAAPDPLFPDVPDRARFAEMMCWIARWFNVLALDDAVARLAGGTLPERAAAVTFDDGYADNAEVALPVLQAASLPATFFVSAGFLDGACMWNDHVIEALRRFDAPSIDLSALGLGRVAVGDNRQRRAAIDRTLAAIKHRTPAERQRCVEQVLEAADAAPASGLMMRPEQLRRLVEAGMAVGGHTVTHPILTRLQPQQAQREIAEGKERLEQITGRPVELFAYPNGVPGQDYDATHVALVRRCGFRAAVSTAWGAAARGADPYQLPRFTPWDRGRLRFGLRLAANLRRAPAYLRSDSPD